MRAPIFSPSPLVFRFGPKRFPWPLRIRLPWARGPKRSSPSPLSHPGKPGALRGTLPFLAPLWGDRAGTGPLPLPLGVTPQGVVSLWLDKNRDGRLTPEEELPSVRASEALLWSVTLLAEPGNGASFSYPLQILWPEGRSYVFLVGGAPRAGEFQGRTVVLVDGDLDGVFGTKGDFWVWTWTGTAASTPSPMATNASASPRPSP